MSAVRPPFPILSKSDFRFSVVSEPSLDSALRRASGDLIAFCPPDDILKPEALSRAEQELRVFPAADAVFADVELPGGAPLWRSMGFGPESQSLFAAGRGFEAFLGLSGLDGSCLLFRSKCRDLLLPLPNSDLLPWALLLIASVSQVRALKRPLAVRAPSAPGTKSPARQRSMARLLSLESLLAAVLERLEPREGPWSKSIALLEAKLEHVRLRMRLRGRGRLSRLSGVLREAYRLDYFRYSGGWASVLSDLIA